MLIPVFGVLQEEPAVQHGGVGRSAAVLAAQHPEGQLALQKVGHSVTGWRCIAAAATGLPCCLPPKETRLNLQNHAPHRLCGSQLSHLVHHGCYVKLGAPNPPPKLPCCCCMALGSILGHDHCGRGLLARQIAALRGCSLDESSRLSPGWIRQPMRTGPAQHAAAGSGEQAEKEKSGKRTNSSTLIRTDVYVSCSGLDDDIQLGTA